ncbi:unnamed protein product [Mytilus coruscus]|uniref:Uncharacterized protein n=1 Tax=Mytilus coruscus TaxID=42192 RepID=A0A6J8ERL2_MYTCO|nr:unnamed protein product [Mytilus coruscus]
MRKRKQNEIKVSSQQSDNAYLIGQNRFCQLLTETNNRDEDGNALMLCRVYSRNQAYFHTPYLWLFSYAVVEFTNDDPPSVAIVHQGWLDSKPDNFRIDCSSTSRDRFTYMFQVNGDHQQDKTKSTPIMPLGNSENHQQDSQSTPIMPLGNSERRKERRREIHILPDLPEEGRLNLPENTSSFERIVLSTLKHVVKNQENIQAELALISGAAVDDEIEDLLPSPASFLIAFGGATCLETVRNTLKKTVTNNILALYSLRGKKGKKVFQDHNLYRVLIRACFKLHKCKRQEIEDCMIEVLKHAPHMPEDLNTRNQLQEEERIYQTLSDSLMIQII